MITDKKNKINKIIVKYIKKLLIPAFHTANLILIMFYLYPGSIFGYLLHYDSSVQPQITRDFIISSNHLYIFVVFSALGIIAYQDTKKIRINYDITGYFWLYKTIIIKQATKYTAWK